MFTWLILVCLVSAVCHLLLPSHLVDKRIVKCYDHALIKVRVASRYMYMYIITSDHEQGWVVYRHLYYLQYFFNTATLTGALGSLPKHHIQRY